ncbi:MAG TPA: carbohydrate ABC transporter permease [Clostridiaceae bacterium]|nr:carbohydrate ABC transporter permease [Clostridiaceae bacterium]
MQYKLGKQSMGSIIFNIFNYSLMIFLACITLFPFMNIVSKAFSSSAKIIAGKVFLFPRDFQLDAIIHVLFEPQFRISFKVSVFVTIVGTLLAMLVTVMTAYPLSKPKLRGRKFFLRIYIFVMLFSGGMVPNYLLFRSLHLLNTIWALILPSMLSVFNMLIVKNFFEQLPESIEEAAIIDGASNMRVLFTIILPISTPVIATVSLFYAVDYWNNYFSAVLYITKQNLRPLQQYLYELIQSSMNLTDEMGVIKDLDLALDVIPESIRAATIVVSTVPILLAYPFLQKYFVKGITIGSVKS